MEPQIPAWVSKAHVFINYLGSFGIIIPALLGWRQRNRLPTPMHAVWWYCIYWSLEAPVNVYCRRVLHQNHPLHHVDVLVETWLLGLAYYEALGRRRQPWWLAAGAFFTAIAVADATIFSDIFHANVYARTVQTILLLACIMLYFERWIHEANRQVRPLDGMFYISAGLFIYYAGSITGYVLAPFARSVSWDAQTALGIVIDALFLGCLGLIIAGFRAERRLQVEAPTTVEANPATMTVPVRRREKQGT
ncbi:hypothetical protein EJV47_25645 [Hymenobacter gummosus]|uniref:Uncharacterized protein n=1 Tax=Hymenobacter gummosus TaxID=1776032 RepID=A0A3S0QE94_9BACT|nr:hypothetical protein [Hymenobacter gummosus]RTQ45265.1 hypothetical protein EJV47_25645 [Hymenobacter gummosus]